MLLCPIGTDFGLLYIVLLLLQWGRGERDLEWLRVLRCRYQQWVVACHTCLISLTPELLSNVTCHSCGFLPQLARWTSGTSYVCLALLSCAYSLVSLWGLVI